MNIIKDKLQIEKYVLFRNFHYNEFTKNNWEPLIKMLENYS